MRFCLCPYLPFSEETRFDQGNRLNSGNFHCFHVCYSAFCKLRDCKHRLYGGGVSNEQASPLTQSMIMGLVEEHERGVASGMNSALWRLPNALSAYIGAYLWVSGCWQHRSSSPSFLYMISIGLFWSYFRKIRMPEESLSQSLPEPLVQDGMAKIK
jgi:hypothetical protein